MFNHQIPDHPLRTPPLHTCHCSAPGAVPASSSTCLCASRSYILASFCTFQLLLTCWSESTLLLPQQGFQMQAHPGLVVGEAPYVRWGGLVKFKLRLCILWCILSILSLSSSGEAMWRPRSTHPWYLHTVLPLTWHTTYCVKAWLKSPKIRVRACRCLVLSWRSLQLSAVIAFHNFKSLYTDRKIRINLTNPTVRVSDDPNSTRCFTMEITRRFKYNVVVPLQYVIIWHQCKRTLDSGQVRVQSKDTDTHTPRRSRESPV